MDNLYHYTFEPWYMKADKKTYAKRHYEWEHATERNYQAAVGWSNGTRMLCTIDVFENTPASDRWLMELFELMVENPHLQWMLPTTHLQNVVDMVEEGYWPTNAWLGLTVHDQDTLNANAKLAMKLKHKYAIPVLFLMASPMEGSIDMTSIPVAGEYSLLDCRTGMARREVIVAEKRAYCSYDSDTYYRERVTGFDWVICQGGDKPLHPDWVRSLQMQCCEVGTPFFFNGWGDWQPVDQSNKHVPRFTEEHVFEDGYISLNLGADKSGSVLDYKEWDQVPEEE